MAHFDATSRDVIEMILMRLEPRDLWSMYRINNKRLVAICNDIEFRKRYIKAVGNLNSCPQLLLLWFDALIDMGWQIRDEDVYKAAADGRIGLVHKMLMYVTPDYDKLLRKATFNAQRQNKLPLIDYLLENTPADPSHLDNQIIRWCARHGEIALVNRLRQDDRVLKRSKNNGV